MNNPEKFYDYLLLKRGFEKITIDGYKSTLNRFFNNIKTIKPSIKQAENYLLEIRKRDYSYSYISGTLVAIKKYMDFIKRPIVVERPRKPKTLPIKDILTEGEIARMFAATKNNREKAMLAILSYCGLRNSEVCRLTVKNIDLENNLVKVIGGKFKKDRIVPMSRECSKIIIDYLNEYYRNGLLFITLMGGKQYNGGALRKMVKVVAKRAKIDKRVYPHLFRHSFISHLISKGANVVAVQQFAGHANLSTTMLYTHLTPKKIRQEYEYYMPNYQ